MSESESEKRDRILLVDDNVDNLQVLFRALEDEGYDLLLAQSGEEALNTAKSAKPSLILLDINMPGWDGYETSRRLKEDSETKHAVIVFLSARGALNDKLTGFDCGAVDYIEKPFQFEEVVARVQVHLATYHRERELELAAGSDRKNSFQNLTEAGLSSVIEAGEGDSIEFKSTLRQNLHTEKADKKIENACLKTIAAFLNTQGGLLLIGVDDEGTALGLEADRFPNHDRILLHLSHLAHTHLGGEFAPFYQGSIISHKGQDVLVVECLRATEPVYFRRDQDEIFFVRSGPATKSLPPSEVVAWVSRK